MKVHAGHTRYGRLGLAAVVAAASILMVSPGGAWAGFGIINVNQHTVDKPCPTPNALPPYAYLRDAWEIDAHSYHVLHHAWTFTRARCYDNADKPRIISDDANFRSYSGVSLGYIGTVCDAAETSRGMEHYEHYQWDLNLAGMQGVNITGWDAFPGTVGDTETAKGYLRELRDGPAYQNCAGMLDGTEVVPLTPNGQLLSSLKTGFSWFDSSAPYGKPVTLIGYGFMGALSAAAAPTSRLSIPGYFKALRKEGGVNLTRVWIAEQWVGQTICGPGAESWTAFNGSMSGNYDLTTLSPSFFKTLRSFVQGAADRGVVVQLSLFDKHGLIKSHSSCEGRWYSSPYWDPNNSQSYLNDPTCAETCNSSCNPELELPQEEELLTCKPSDGFVDPTWEEGQGIPSARHEALVRRVALEVGGIGNVIFEIINEAIKDLDGPGSPTWDGDWNTIPAGETLDLNEQWQYDTAHYLRLNLPRDVSRDAFNGEAAEGPLNGKAPDRGMSWATDSTLTRNTWVQSVLEDDTQIEMGYVHAAIPSQGPDMRGTLPIALYQSYETTAYEVRADVARYAENMALGLEESDGDSIYIELQPCTSPCNHLAVLKKKVGGVTTTLSSAQITGQGSAGNLRLHVNETPRVYLYFNGNAIISNVNPTFSLVPSRGFFWGRAISGNYLYSDGSVDNFEVGVYCNDPAVPTCLVDAN